MLFIMNFIYLWHFDDRLLGNKLMFIFFAYFLVCSSLCALSFFSSKQSHM